MRTFPEDFYQQLFRLRQLEYPTGTVRRPRNFGAITNDIVYKRLAPGVLDELKRVQVKDERGRPKHKLFHADPECGLSQTAGAPRVGRHAHEAEH